ncbi:hypothetical protein L484_011994 [Morus notabilis]|uniref:Uncharacterized protein n=1 Tax=Morus notabilis TaxID=981085 RepID=W9RH62_9ROSA|nr:hypothetical protein L484_011994 [Morus notabilis]
MLNQTPVLIDSYPLNQEKRKLLIDNEGQQLCAWTIDFDQISAYSPPTAYSSGLGEEDKLQEKGGNATSNEKKITTAQVKDKSYYEDSVSFGNHQSKKIENHQLRI